MTKRPTNSAGAPAARRAQPIDDVADLDSFFSFRVSVLAKLLDRRLARLLADQFGLALAEYRVLAQIAAHPRSTVRAIAGQTYVDKAQVSRSVAVLEERGLLARTASDTDRRSPEFTATRSGRALMNKIIPLHQAQERDVAERLTRSDLTALTTAVRTLITHLS